ncbi:unnamed protein product [Rotaria sp. Silwood2]|nr:unnamed protein product [Rotaria sp. Silwood2]
MPSTRRPIPCRCRTMFANGSFRLGGCSVVHRCLDLAIKILASAFEEINHLCQIFLDEFRSSLNTNQHLESFQHYLTDFEELFKFQLNFTLE